MTKPRIAIACQGGGSQTAFTAGVLHALFEEDIQKDFEIVSLSGTSGGAVCASLVWYALKRGEPDVCRRLMAFWQDNTPQSPYEWLFNDVVVKWLRAVNAGSWPSLSLSPASPMVQAAMSFATTGIRESFSDFRRLLQTHIDFAEIACWGARSDRPVLLLGAVNILTGRLAKFNSRLHPIQVEHILASCAVPSIFPAVEIGKDAYWDGLFSDNPPVDELIRPSFVGEGNIAEEIWLIKINPTTRSSIPVRTDDIIDRRNQLEGNVSLFQQMVHLETFNDLLMSGAFKEEFLKQWGVKAPVRIPNIFHDEPDRPYHIPCIEMSRKMQGSLDYEGKIDRSAENIEMLIEHGKKKGREFLEERAKMVAGAPRLRPPSSASLPSIVR
jgi:NTE family protein